MSNPAIIDWLTTGGLLLITGFSVGTYIKSNGTKDSIEKEIMEFKKEITTMYAKKEICDITHKAIDESLNEVKENVKCIPEIKAGVELLLKQQCLDH